MISPPLVKRAGGKKKKKKKRNEARKEGTKKSLLILRGGTGSLYDAIVLRLLDYVPVAEFNACICTVILLSHPRKPFMRESPTNYTAYIMRHARRDRNARKAFIRKCVLSH